MDRVFFSESDISAIRERSNILEIVSDYVSLKKSGRNYKGLCPFHSEKTPSFMVNEEKQIFHCFGCGEGGDIFTFLMKIKGLSFPEAVDELAKRYGIRLSEPSVKKKREFAKKELLLELNHIASEYFYTLLHSSKGKDGWNYLIRRGINKDIIEEYRLGYSLDQWDGLVKYLNEKKLPMDLAVEVGLVIPKKKEGWYDTFRNRIIFPIFDIHNRVIGFGGRLIKEGEPKYINSPESIVYHKGETLYGLQVAKRFISEKDFAVIVEGYFDLLTLHQFGIKNSVATLGTALTSQHIRILKRYTDSLYTVFDADEAGLKASLRCLPLFLEEDVTAKIITLPKGDDPDTFLRKGNREGFEKLITNAFPMIDFFFEILEKRFDLRTIEGKVKMAKEAIAMLNKIPDRIKKGLYIKALADKIEIQESILHEIVQSPPKKGNDDLNKMVIKRVFPKSEEMLIQLLIHNPQYIPILSKYAVLDQFQSIALKSIGKDMEKQYLKKGRLELSEILISIDEDMRAILSKLAFEDFQLEKEHAEKLLRDCIRKIMEEKIKKDKIELLKKIKEAEKRGGGRVLEGLLKERQELTLREKALLEIT